MDELESTYRERIDWPRSIFDHEKLKDQTIAFENTIGTPELLDWSGMASVVEDGYLSDIRATRFEFDATGRDLSKSSGLPTFGTKLSQLGAAKQYVDEVLKPNPELKNAYPNFQGFRTQMSSPDDPKVRLVWLVPITVWYMQVECYGQAIKIAVSEAGSGFSTPFYFDLPTLQQVFNEYSAEATQIVVLDWLQFDSEVHRMELEDAIRYSSGDYDFVDFIVSYELKSECLTPQGYVERDGGLSSGSVGTNYLGGRINVVRIINGLERIGLLRYLVNIIFNGDDIILFLNTKLTNDNLNKFGKHVYGTLQPEKSEMKQSTAWFSKLYLDPESERPYKPVGLVLNSLSFMERTSDPARAGKYYQSIAAWQILQYIEYHPFGPEIIREFKRHDKYPIEGMPHNELVAAADLWLGDHSWMRDAEQVPITGEELVNQIKDKAATF
jgi:hypothetical protein